MTHPALMRALAARNVPIFSCQPIRADLEGAFWDLALSPEPDAAADPRRKAA
jgi:hypothetical protein